MLRILTLVPQQRCHSVTLTGSTSVKRYTIYGRRSLTNVNLHSFALLFNERHADHFARVPVLWTWGPLTVWGPRAPCRHLSLEPKSSNSRIEATRIEATCTEATCTEATTASHQLLSAEGVQSPLTLQHYEVRGWFLHQKFGNTLNLSENLLRNSTWLLNETYSKKTPFELKHHITGFVTTFRHVQTC